jgi:WD40 repeat protein
MKTIIFASLSFFIVINIFAQPDKEYQSYLAHISAANSSLRLNEKKEAKRWLNNAPEKFRGWEWNYLNKKIDGSLKTFNPGKETPTRISYSNDGMYLAFGDTKGVVRILNSQTLKEVKQLIGHQNSIYSVRFSPDDTKLISCSRDTTIRIWKFKSGKEIGSIKTEGRGLADVDISPDGKKLVYCSWYMKENGVNGFINLYDFETKEKVWTTDYNTHPLVAVRFSPDGKRFAVGSWEENVSLWNLDNLNSPTILDFGDVKEYSAVDDIAISPDGKFIASATKNTTPRIWDIETGESTIILSHFTNPIYQTRFYPDRKNLIVNSMGVEIV